MDDRRVADYFVIAGLPDEPVPIEEFSNEAVLKATYKQDPIVDVAVINRSLGEGPPPKFRCVEFTPTGFPADLNHGGIRAPEMYLCYRRGRDKPPLVDIGVLYEGKERVLAGCEVIYQTHQGRPANVNNTNSSRIYVTYRRAEPNAACDTLAVTDICVILLNKGECAPHAYCMIGKTLNKGMMGSDVYLCYKKSMVKTHFLTYQPAVLCRYPLEDIPSLPLPEKVAMFCLPLGATVEAWPVGTRHPSAIFSTFILTAASSEKLYGAAVTFYESLPEDRLDDTQRRQLDLPVLDPPPSETVDSTGVSMSHDSRGAAGKIASPVSLARTVHQNKCICVLSRSPFFNTFKRFLSHVWQLSLTGPHPVPLERHIVHFMTEVPLPSPQRPKILIQLNSIDITLSQPDETPLPKSGASMIEMLKNLGAANCVTLLLCTLMEQKLLIHSLRPAVLTSVAEAVANMIFPFHWQCPYIPLCPLGLSYVLNSPTPFIVGIDSRYFDLYDPPVDVTCVDLDTNSMTGSEDKKTQMLKSLPKKAAKVLKSTLERLFEQLCQDPSLSSGVSSYLDEFEDPSDVSHCRQERYMELAIQEAFLRFMAVILKGYNNFLLPITKAPTLVTTDVSSLFDIQGFLKSRDRAYHKFYIQMMKTQAFSRFIEERSFASDKDTGLAFFDECLEKVDETREDQKLIELDDARRSDVTVFVMLPEAIGLPPGVEYSYDGFPTLNPDLFPPCSSPAVQQSSLLKPLLGGGMGGGGGSVGAGINSSCPYSPMTRRTTQEMKSAQKLAIKHSNTPIMWAKCLVWHCYSLWFIHLPAYVKTVHSKAKALRMAYDVLVRMQSAKLQPPDEVCYRVLMQLCGLYHQPVLAVKVLFEMKRNNVQPNAITYGFYNKAVLESKWPSSSTTAYQRWIKLRHTLVAVSQFKLGIRSVAARRRTSSSICSNSESDYDGQSMDSTSYIDGVNGSGLGASDSSRNSVGVGASTSILRDLASVAGNDKRGVGVETQGNMVPGGAGVTGEGVQQCVVIGEVIGVSDNATHETSEISQADGDTMDLDSIIPPPSGQTSEQEQTHFTVPGTSISDQSNDEYIRTRSDNITSLQASEDSSTLTADENLGTGTEIVNDSELVEVNVSRTTIDEGAMDVISESTAVAEQGGVDNDDSSNLTIVVDASSDVPDDANRTLVATPVSVITISDDFNNLTTASNVVENSAVVESFVTEENAPNIAVTDPLSQSDAVPANRPLSMVNRVLSGPSGERLARRPASAIDRTGSSQSLTSPVHSVRTPVTQNDPLGLFNHSVTTVSAPPVPPSTEKAPDVRSRHVVEALPWSNDHRVLSRRSSEASGLSAVSADMNYDSRQDAPSTPQHVSLGIGSAMRSAATRFASRYREMKQSMTTTAANGSASSGSINSMGSAGVEPQLQVGGAGEERRAVGLGVEEVIRGETRRASVADQGDRISATDLPAPGEVAAGENKSRLRVPELYAPLVSGLRVGLKSIQQNERFQSMATSLQTITATVRETLIDSIAADDWSPPEGFHPEMAYAWSSEDGDRVIGVSAESIDSIPSLQSDPVGNGYASGGGGGQQSGVSTADRSFSIEDSSERGSVAGEQFQLPPGVGGSSTSVPSISTPLDVEISSLSKCQGCSNLLYDEEIMAGWTPDDSNLNTICQFCGSKLVPLLQIYIKDLRHCLKPVLTNLSQSMESMFSVQSAPNVQLGGAVNPSASEYKRCLTTGQNSTIPEDSVPHQHPQITHPSTEERLSFHTVQPEQMSDNEAVHGAEASSAAVQWMLTSTENIPQSATDSVSEVTFDESSNSGDNAVVAKKQYETEKQFEADSSRSNAVDIRADVVDSGIVVESSVSVTTRSSEKQRVDVTKRWSSTCLDSTTVRGGGINDDCMSTNKADSGTGSLESRRCLSECSLSGGFPEETLVRRKSLNRSEVNSSSVGNKLDDGSRVISNGSDGKGIINGLKKPVELEPISVPYLSPLVLRKEMENVLEQDGEACLNRAEFVDEHPILYWNLVWYFKRINVPSHILGFLLTAGSLNRNTIPSSVWMSGDSRHVSVHARWDNPRMYNECGQPMYVSWKNNVLMLPKETVSSKTPLIEQPDWSKRHMQEIVSSIMANNVVTPLRLILNERSKRKSQNGRVIRFYSIYRDILFLSFLALGRENIDHDAFDREFKNMLNELPANEITRMRVVDRYPNATTCYCRKLFEELELL